MKNPATQARQARIHALRDLFFTMLWMGHRQMVQRLQSYDLTHPQFITLASLVAHGQPVSMRELSDVTFQDAPSMTRIVDRLVKMAWVRRTRDAQDRRVVLVEATESGSTLIKKIECEHHEDDSHGFNVMSDQDLDKMEDFMDHILGVYLRKTDRTSGDLESAKQYLKKFAEDPIGYLKMNKDSA
ncbi:MAG: MarR family transcriptional regulator [Chloroflexota bacterium]